MFTIDAMQQSVAYLKERGCLRDAGSGLWLTVDGDPLASDPTDAARALRSHLLNKELAERRASGRHFTR